MPEKVGHQDGVVCPAFGFPVGTGGMIIGNHNFVSSNHVWDNWRQGFMLFWVPPALMRDDYDPTHQQDNSNFNAFTKNELGYSPKGEVLPNGIDFFWDEAGQGNWMLDQDFTMTVCRSDRAERRIMASSSAGHLVDPKR